MQRLRLRAPAQPAEPVAQGSGAVCGCTNRLWPCPEAFSSVFRRFWPLVQVESFLDAIFLVASGISPRSGWDALERFGRGHKTACCRQQSRHGQDRQRGGASGAALAQTAGSDAEARWSPWRFAAGPPQAHTVGRVARGARPPRRLQPVRCRSPWADPRSSRPAPWMRHANAPGSPARPPASSGRTRPFRETGASAR